MVSTRAVFELLLELNYLFAMDVTTKPYPIIGMSPGNSYFKDEEIRYLLKEVVARYGRVAILVADTPAISTYVALGYPQNKARNKAIPKGNNLKNRTRRIMEELGFSGQVVRIIDWDGEVASDLKYQEHYKKIEDLYKHNDAFSKAVNETTLKVLEGSDKLLGDINRAVEVATHYLLSEFAFLEFAPSFLGSDRVLYVYHKNWPVYEDYIAGKFGGGVKLHMDFLLLENPYETYVSLGNVEGVQSVESVYDRVLRTKVIRASYEDYPPTFMVDMKTRKYSGIFFDILSKIAKEYGFTLQFTEETGYGVIVEGLQEGRFDVFAATVWPTPERVALADFSQPVYCSDVYAWQVAGNESVLSSVAVKENDISHSIALADYSDFRLVYVPQLADPLELLGFVARGKADMTFAEPYLVDIFNAQSDAKLVRAFEGKLIRRYANAFIIKKGEKQWKELLDSVIIECLRNGFISDLIKQYTGRSDTFELPEL